MNHIFYISNDCLEVFLSDATSTEDDELLAKALNFMRNSGLTVHLKGFDKYNRPIVDIDGVIHTADKNGTLGLSQRFIIAKHQISILENSERYNNIIKLLA